MKMILEESHAVPYVHVNVVLRSGALHDPEGLEGTAYLASQMLTRGTKTRSRAQFDEELDALGGELDVSVGRESVVLEGEVLSRNLEPFVALMGEALREPAFDPDELGLLRRLTIAELEQVRDSDGELCGEAFNRHMWGAHPYGRPAKGTVASLERIGQGELLARQRTHVVEPNLLVAAAGDVTQEQLARLVQEHLSGLGGEAPAEHPMPEPARGGGVRAQLVDKPERSQTQVRWGHPCVMANHPDVIPLSVGNTIFGGTFTARLMQEIREKRGWSYGAYSRLFADRRTGAVTISYQPAVEDTVASLELGHALFEALSARGVTAEELAFARSYLANAFAFQVETPARRMWQHVQIELLGRPANWLETYVSRISAVTLDEVNAALRAHLSPSDLALTVVCTADTIREGVAALPFVSDVSVVPYDEVA
jgi:zinc protease